MKFRWDQSSDGSVEKSGRSAQTTIKNTLSFGLNEFSRCVVDAAAMYGYSPATLHSRLVVCSVTLDDGCNLDVVLEAGVNFDCSCFPSNVVGFFSPGNKDPNKSAPQKQIAWIIKTPISVETLWLLR